MTRRPLPLLLVALLLLSSLAPLASAGEAWTKETGSAITAVATDEYGDRIFVGTESGMLYCYDSAGSVVWSVQLAAVGADPSILDIRADTEGHIWVRCGNAFYLRNAETGANIWSHRDPAISPEGGDLSNTGIALDVWDLLFDLKIPSTGHTIYRGWGSYNNGAISGDGTWVVVTEQADPNLYLYSVNPPPDDWIAPQNGFGWENRVSHTIAGSTGGALTNYPVEITVIRGSGTSSGSTVYAPECRADFADIRFTSSDGVTEIPYYLESVVGSTATFLVNVPSIPASPGTTTIYAYWGYPITIATTSDPAAQWILYDDFEDGVIDSDLWVTSTSGSGTVQEAGGAITIDAPPTAPGSWAYLMGKTQYTYPVNVKINITLPSTYLDSSLNRIPFFNMGETFSTEYTGGDGTIDLVAPGGGSKLADNIARANQTLDLWYSPGEDFWLKYGSDWNGTVSYSTSSLLVKMVAGQEVNHVCGQVQINEIAVTRWTPNPPTHGAWGPVESVATPLDTKTLDGTIVDIDAPETGDWVAVSTTTKTYIIQITDSGFGTIYSADRIGTPYQIAVADGGSFAIEGRSILADIFRIDATQVGTYTTGGPVQHVALAQKNGLYTAAGSDDGKYYVFSKDAASSWYLLHASDSYDPVTALAMTWRGELLIIGRADGRLTAFQVSEQDAAGTIKLNVFKDNKPYAAAPLRIEESDDGTTWGAPTTLTTDSYGSVALPVQWGNRYRITVGDGETETTLQASSIKTEYVIVVPSELPVRLHLDYSTEYDPATGDIWLRYVDDEAKTNAVTFRLYRTADNALEYEETFSTIPAEGLLTNHTVSWTNSSYRVQMSAIRDGQTITNTWHQWVGADVAALPSDLDNGIRLGIWFVVILFVAGLFSYLTGPQGAVVTSLFAAFLVLIDWLPLQPAVAALCVVWAFLGLLGRTSAER